MENHPYRHTWNNKNIYVHWLLLRVEHSLKIFATAKCGHFIGEKYIAFLLVIQGVYNSLQSSPCGMRFFVWWLIILGVKCAQMGDFSKFGHMYVSMINLMMHESTVFLIFGTFCS